MIDHSGMQSVHDHCDHDACGDNMICCRCVQGTLLTVTGQLTEAQEQRDQLREALGELVEAYNGVRFISNVGRDQLVAAAEAARKLLEKHEEAE